MIITKAISWVVPEGIHEAKIVDANNQIRVQQGLRGQPVDVHEIQPVKFGGSATDPANKVILDRATHRQQVTPWWNQLMRDITGG